MLDLLHRQVNVVCELWSFATDSTSWYTAGANQQYTSRTTFSTILHPACYITRRGVSSASVADTPHYTARNTALNSESDGWVD